MISEAVSPAKVISPVLDGDKYEVQIAQLEAIHLNGQCTADLLKSLLDLVHKLNEDITYLKNDNSFPSGGTFCQLKFFHGALPELKV
jgi:hypothetical protein